MGGGRPALCVGAVFGRHWGRRRRACGLRCRPPACSPCRPAIRALTQARAQLGKEQAREVGGARVAHCGQAAGGAQQVAPVPQRAHAGEPQLSDAPQAVRRQVGERRARARRWRRLGHGWLESALRGGGQEQEVVRSQSGQQQSMRALQAAAAAPPPAAAGCHLRRSRSGAADLPPLRPLAAPRRPACDCEG